MSNTPFLGVDGAVYYDGLLSHTTQFIEKKKVVQDAIFSANPVLHELRKLGSVAPGGTDEQVNLMYGKNTTFGWYKGYDIQDIAPQEGLTSAFYEWAQASIAVSISGREVRINRGPQRLKDLIKTKHQQAIMTVAEEFNEALWVNTELGSTLPFGGKGIYSIPMLIDNDVDRDRKIGGINGLTSPWWRNNFKSMNGDNDALSWKMAIGNMYNTCEKEGRLGGPPKIIACDQASYEKYEGSMIQQRTYESDDRASSGYKHIYFKDAKMLWDDKIPDMGLDTQTYVDGAMVFINPEFFTIRVMAGADWTWGAWEKPIDQDAKVNSAYWMGQVVVSNRRKHGLIADLTKDAFTS
jgi:hypothetical protein